MTSSSVGRWIKTQLSLSGINTEEFSAHLVRGAAGSKAYSSGVSIQTILLKGHWAKESTFGRFNQRPIENNQFEEGILGE